MEFYSVRILRSLEEKLLAKRLLYKVYVEELDWIIPEDNPSNLKIEESRFGNILVDDYDLISTQFGGFYGEKLIAVHRIISPLNGRLEVENYTQLPLFLQENCYHELNRLAIDIIFRKSPIFVLMLATAIKYMMECGCKYLIGTATFPEHGNLFCKIGGTKIDFPEFKYHVTDPKPVSLIVLFLEEKDRFNRLFKLVDKLKITNSNSQF